jgi:GT2 family glycosyltransferase
MISVCVVAYKNTSEMRPLIASLADFLIPTDEILIFDNDPLSVDEELIKALSCEYQLSVTYVKSEENIGFAAACNKLARLSENDRLIFLNPDTEMTSFVRTAHVGETVIGPIVFNYLSKPEITSGYRRNIREEIRLRWGRREPKVLSDQPLLYISGVAISINQKMFLDVGGFSEQYFMYYEDIDLGLRLKEIGVSPVIDPNWQIRHVGGSSAKKLPLESAKRSYKSSLLFHINWGNNWVVYIVFSLLDAFLRIFYHLLKMNFVQSMTYLKLILYIGTQSRSIVAMKKFKIRN